MMSKIPIKNKLSMAHLGQNSPIFNLIKSKTKLSENPSSDESIPVHSYWSSTWWGLDKSPLFQEFSLETQKKILSLCNQNLLNEAYFIEKSGLAYTAKMGLLSESTDTAQLYALIGADEARHLAWIEPFIPEVCKTQPTGSFLDFLSALIENAPPQQLIYLVQIILEGWGLDHYKRMANGCQSQELTNVLNQILKDEALHHKSGLTLFSPRSLSLEDMADIKVALLTYTQMVQVGPISILESVERVAGKLKPNQLEQLLHALDHENQSQRKLTLLKSLMSQPGLENMIQSIEDAGQFTPLSNHQAAQFYYQFQDPKTE